MSGFQIKRFNTKRALISVGVLIFIYASLLFVLMRIEEDAPNRKIIHLQDAIWYLLETLTTVGYGDVLPVTYWGRMIGFVFLVSSLGVYGFIIGQIANFMNTIQESKMLGFSGTNFKNHVVMIGWNRVGFLWRNVAPNPLSILVII